MEFSQVFLNNKLFYDTALTFDKLCPEHMANLEPIQTGVQYLPNGDAAFRLYLPNAKKVELGFFNAGTGMTMLPLTKDVEGYFTGVLPYDPKESGPRTISVFVDETVLLYPYLPIYWTSNRPCNYIESPDPEGGFYMVQNVPHGAMCREIIPVESTGAPERFMVYTPPGYLKTDREYPVLYLINGGTDNEICWDFTGRIAYIMDNLIAEGKCKPFLIVMCNSMLRKNGEIPFFYHGVATVDDTVERMLLDDCIPYIERNYRVKTDKWNRAIAGLSMGAYITCDIGLAHPEVFGNMATFTACMTHETITMDYERPFPKALANAKMFEENYRLFFRSTTPLEDHFNYFEADDQICAEAGIDKLPCYHRTVYSATTSKWNSWRKGVRDFATLLFR